MEFNKKTNSPFIKLGFDIDFAGAIGNIIDSVFYGVIFSDSYGKIAEIFPEKVMLHYFMVMLLICFSSL